MRRLSILCVLFFCGLTEAGDLSLKDGLVLKDAEVRGVSGKNVIIVKHSGGVGMYAYTRFSPDSAAVISNRFPDAAKPLPVATPAPPPSAEAVSALSINAELYKAARKRLDASIERERVALSSKLDGATSGDTSTLKSEINSHNRSIRQTESAIAQRNTDLQTRARIDRDASVQTPRGRYTGSERTLVRLEGSDSDLRQLEMNQRRERDIAESDLQNIKNGKNLEMNAFEATAYERQQKLVRIGERHNRRIRADEILTQENMKAAFDSIE